MCKQVAALLLTIACSGVSRAETLTFDNVLARAEASAPDLAAGLARREGAQSAAISADALPDPKGVIGIENLPVEGPDRFRLQRDFMTMQKLGVMQEIPNGRKRSARARSARAEVEVADATLAQTRSRVRQEAAAAWLERYYLGRQQSVLAELQEDNRLLQQAVEGQVRSGKRRAADALMPRQEALELASRLDEVAGNIAKADAELRRWTGLPDPIDVAGDPPDFAFAPAQWRAHLPHHADLLRFRPEQEVAEAELDEARAALRPDWGVEFDYQHRGDTFGDMVSFQVSADLPLFSRTRQTPQIRARQQALVQLEAEQEAMRREHAAALEADIGTLTAMARQRERLRQDAIPLATRKVELQLAGYRAGSIELADVLTARRELREQQLAALSLEAQYQILLARTHLLIESPEVQP